MREQSCGENSASNKKSGSNYTLGTFLSFLSSLSFSFSFLSFHDPPSPLCNLSIPFRVNEQVSKASKKRARRVEEVTNPQVFSFFQYAAVISFTNEFADELRIVALREIFISPLKPPRLKAALLTIQTILTIIEWNSIQFFVDSQLHVIHRF